MTRHYVLAFGASVLTITAILAWDTRGPTPSQPMAAGASMHPLEAADRLTGEVSSGRANRRARGSSLRFEDLPSGYQPVSVQRISHDLQAWLVEPGRSEVNPQLIAVDCAQPPCILELDYDVAVGGDDFLDQLDQQLPSLTELEGLKREQLDRADSRRRVWLYWSPPGLDDAQASARTRIAASQEALAAGL